MNENWQEKDVGKIKNNGQQLSKNPDLHLHFDSKNIEFKNGNSCDSFSEDCAMDLTFSMNSLFLAEMTEKYPTSTMQELLNLDNIVKRVKEKFPSSEISQNSNSEVNSNFGACAMVKKEEVNETVCEVKESNVNQSIVHVDFRNSIYEIPSLVNNIQQKKSLPFEMDIDVENIIKRVQEKFSNSKTYQNSNLEVNVADFRAMVQKEEINENVCEVKNLKDNQSIVQMDSINTIQQKESSFLEIDINAENLIKRVKEKFSSSKPYQCIICAKQFSRKSSLKRHQLIHTNELQHVLPQHKLPQHEMPQHETPQLDLPQHEMPQHELPQYELPQQELTQHEMPLHETPQLDLPQPELPQRKLPQHEMSRHETHQLDLPQHEIPQLDLPQHEMPQLELPQHELPQQEMPQHEMHQLEPEQPQQELPQHEMPQHETPQLDLPQLELPEHELPQHELFQYKLPQHEMPQYEMPQLWPQQELPQHELPQHEMPKHEIPQLLPQEELPQHEMLLYKAPQLDLPQHKVPQHELPQHEMSQHEVPHHELTEHVLPPHELPQHKLPQNELPQHELTQYEPQHGKQLFTCKVYKTFTQNASLKRHKTIHTGDKPYACQFCNNTFRLKQHVKVHERYHTGEKPFNCKICNKGFADYSNKKNHELRHTKEKLISCNLIDLVSLANEKMIKKEDAPSTYACNYCGEHFNQYLNMQKHQLNHLQELSERLDY